MQSKWLEWAKELQFIAQCGLTYSEDVFDIERFERIREISIEIMSNYTEIDEKKINDSLTKGQGKGKPLSFRWIAERE